MQPRSWFKLTVAADSQEVADLDIFGSIGQSWWDDDAVSAKQFLDELSALPKNVKTIRVRVNSPGGSVFDGIAIANALRDQQAKGRTVETSVEGIAASAASIVIMAGQKIRIADNALIMVHHAWTIEIGNAATMRKTADVLDQITDSIIATYGWHSELSAEELRALMDAETWMDADEAIEKGFATEKVEGLKAAASIDPRVASKLKVPERFKARVDELLAKPEQPAPAPQPAAATDILRLCTEAQLDLQFANALIAAKVVDADLPARIAAEKDTRVKAQQRAEGIAAACALAKVPDLADGYIKGSMSLDAVKAHLVTIKAHLDKVEIDGHLDPNAGAPNHSAGWKKAFTLARGSRH